MAAAAPSLTVGTSIANVHARDPVAMRAAAATLHELTGGRAILGLGVGHKTSVEEVRGGTYGRPVEVLRRYLEAYAAAPYRGPVPHGSPRVVIAALRERMVDLAGAASDGAFPYLVPARAIAPMRDRLDAAALAAGRPRPLLIVAQAVRPEPDPDLARSAATAYVRPYLGLPNYANSLGSLGYAASDLAPEPSERLVDDLVLWGDPASIRDRLRAILAAGADQVAVIPLARGRHARRHRGRGGGRTGSSSVVGGASGGTIRRWTRPRSTFPLS